jgi:hypothetical protein
MSFTYKRLNKDDAVVLLVDHQAGLLSLVRDYSPDEFKNNVLALADIAKFFKLPTILTTSFEQGPNGPIVPELKAMFPDAPYIARPGQINAWDNADFVNAIKATGRKQLIIAGVVGAGRGVRRICGHRRLRHLQHLGTRCRADPHGACRRTAAQLVQCRLRAAPRLAQRHRGLRRYPRWPPAGVCQPDPELQPEVAGRAPAKRPLDERPFSCAVHSDHLIADV